MPGPPGPILLCGLICKSQVSNIAVAPTTKPVASLTGMTTVVVNGDAAEGLRSILHVVPLCGVSSSMRPPPSGLAGGMPG